MCYIAFFVYILSKLWFWDVLPPFENYYIYQDMKTILVLTDILHFVEHNIELVWTFSLHKYKL